MRAPGRATTYDDCDDDDDDDGDDDVGSSPRRPTGGLCSHWTADKDRFRPVIEPISYQKRKNKYFRLLIMWTDSSLLQAILTCEGLVSLSKKSDLPLTGKLRIFYRFLRQKRPLLLFLPILIVMHMKAQL